MFFHSNPEVVPMDFFLGLQAFAYCVHFNQKGELYGFQHLLSG